jgi:hypothetical protein
MPPSHLTEIVQGIADIDKLQTCDAVLSGYLGRHARGDDAALFRMAHHRVTKILRLRIGRFYLTHGCGTERLSRIC